MKASQALALLRGRSYVVPDDIKELLHPVLEHRIILHHDERTRGADAATVLDEVITSITVPVPGASW
jgi:MoxR-like ATPase